MTTLEMIMNEFLIDNDFECEAIYDENSDCYYDDIEELICFGGLTNKIADVQFMDYCKELGLHYNVNVATMSFLHELGHFETMHLLEDEEMIISELAKIKAEAEENYRVYFTCPIEYEATMWAVDYVNNNFEKIERLNKKMLDIFG